VAKPLRATQRAPRRGYTTPAPVGTRYTVHTSAGAFTVEEDGQHWTPGSPMPEGVQPNPLRALARCAEVAAFRGVYAPGRQERRAA
jgi:hypothetical protein